MKISQQLDTLRGGFPEIQALAYADLAVQMTIVTSTDIDIAQERWDELCKDGVAMLTQDPARDALGAMIYGEDISCAVVLQGSELGVFLKSSGNVGDAIFCVSRSGLAIDAFVNAAGCVLTRIATDG